MPPIMRPQVIRISMLSSLSMFDTHGSLSKDSRKIESTDFEFGITGGVICVAVSGSRIVFYSFSDIRPYPGGYRKIT